MKIGIDIGGMSIKIGMVNDRNEIVEKKVIPTNSQDRTQEAVVEAIAQAVCEMAGKGQAALWEYGCVGVACPGTVDGERGVVLYSNNLKWEDLPLVELLKRHIPAPVRLANDADAAAYGEVLAGAAKDKENAILLTLGTGVGGGVILGGKIFSGRLRGGCELGHMVIKKGGRLCTCGRRGCFEQYASAAALMAAGRKAAGQNRDSLLWQLCSQDLSALRGEHIFEAARLGDGAAQEVVVTYEEDLCEGIANLINIFRPEVVILGGGVSAQGENLTDVLQNKVKALCFGGAWGEIPPIVTSALGNDAGIIGAANLC